MGFHIDKEQGCVQVQELLVRCLMVRSTLNLIICVWGASQPQGRVTINFYSYLKILNFYCFLNLFYFIGAFAYMYVCMRVLDP